MLVLFDPRLQETSLFAMLAVAEFLAYSTIEHVLTVCRQYLPNIHADNAQDTRQDRCLEVAHDCGVVLTPVFMALLCC